MNKPQTPPGHLTSAAKDLWRSVATGYVLEPHHLRMLTAACEAWDRMTEARETLAAEGTIYRDRFGAPRKHPAVSIEENARLQFLRAIRELHLDSGAEDDVRITRLEAI